MKVITFKEMLAGYGKEFADRILSHARHHHDDAGNPYWVEEVFEELQGLVEAEDAELSERCLEHESEARLDDHDDGR